MTPATALLLIRVLDLLALAALKAPEVKARYDRAIAKIRELIEDGREPSNDEFAEVIAESDAGTERLRAAAGLPPGP
jgi:hypothetical protein